MSAVPGLEGLAQLIGDPGPCPVCDEHDCTHAFYGPDHPRIGDSPAKRRTAVAKKERGPEGPPRKSRKGRRAHRPQEDRAHHPDSDREPGTEGDRRASRRADVPGDHGRHGDS